MKKAKSRKLKLVLDTNVWVSGIIFGGHPGKIIKLFAENEVIIAYSDELLTELRRIINHKFPAYNGKLKHLEQSINKDAEKVQLGSLTVTICRDPDDDKFIETALIAGGEYIVSGDNDLLSIGSHHGVVIVNPSQFIKAISE